MTITEEGRHKQRPRSGQCYSHWRVRRGVRTESFKQRATKRCQQRKTPRTPIRLPRGRGEQSANREATIVHKYTTQETAVGRRPPSESRLRKGREGREKGLFYIIDLKSIFIFIIIPRNKIKKKFHLHNQDRAGALDGKCGRCGLGKRRTSYSEGFNPSQNRVGAERGQSRKSYYVANYLSISIQ
jgi:hypothetical protein